MAELSDARYISLTTYKRDGSGVATPVWIPGYNSTSVDLEREANRHYAFGADPHRCLGSHLARLEMRLALDEWHARIPNYWLDGGVSSYAGTVMGITTLPLRWAGT
jgi:cytochrome P450